MTDSASLTGRERERFAEWLDMDAETDDLLIAQLEAISFTTVADDRRKDAEAKRRIARMLRATESQVMA